MQDIISFPNSGRSDEMDFHASYTFYLYLQFSLIYISIYPKVYNCYVIIPLKGKKNWN